MAYAKSARLLCRYHYDPLDRHSSNKIVEQQLIQLFYCASHVATQIQGTVKYSVLQHDQHLLAQCRHESSHTDAQLFATNQQRSIMTVNGPQLRHLAYSPYGHLPHALGLTSLLGFNGERRDPLTGYYDLGQGYRQFNPVLMRFNSPDSWSPFGDGGLNAYAYCLGDPVNRTDGTGHAPVPPLRLVKPVKPLKTPIATLINGRKNYKKLRDAAQQIDRNELALPASDKKYTVSSNVETLALSELAYEHARLGYGFENRPDVNTPHFYVERPGKVLLDVAHFDIVVYRELHRAKSISPRAATSSGVFRAKIRRAEYIKKHTGIDLMSQSTTIRN